MMEPNQHRFPLYRLCPALQAPGGAFVGLAHSGVPDDEGWLARLEHAAAVSPRGGRV